MAPTAFIEMGLAVDLFEKGAKFSRRARSGIVSLLFEIFAWHGMTIAVAGYSS